MFVWASKSDLCHHEYVINLPLTKDDVSQQEGPAGRDPGSFLFSLSLLWALSCFERVRKEKDKKRRSDVFKRRWWWEKEKDFFGGLEFDIYATFWLEPKLHCKERGKEEEAREQVSRGAERRLQAATLPHIFCNYVLSSSVTPFSLSRSFFHISPFYGVPFSSFTSSSIQRCPPAPFQL